jgi:hypothetical protein
LTDGNKLDSRMQISQIELYDPIPQLCTYRGGKAHAEMLSTTRAMSSIELARINSSRLGQSRFPAQISSAGHQVNS